MTNVSQLGQDVMDAAANVRAGSARSSFVVTIYGQRLIVSVEPSMAGRTEHNDGPRWHLLATWGQTSLVISDETLSKINVASGRGQPDDQVGHPGPMPPSHNPAPTDLPLAVTNGSHAPSK